ncbi:hypothetical protein BO86DRAFT_193392 [Aspergillus japonicus CBS 114.51]|uniref:Uncharacterized protein n=1 Tax=Aspergillus japonicus CBS 114.51 TaxID=1448312 RepID=A0A8T8WRH8_ASPJA|nr:hypothetical protein BO86DRAFT_193392 [Aspergillus japonicus CBS 114.51]RAH78270.1 hypothetical protein BO86DRAFT_193392 [Aspergillus japonicus CBS 114.51]
MAKPRSSKIQHPREAPPPARASPLFPHQISTTQSTDKPVHSSGVIRSFLFLFFFWWFSLLRPDPTTPREEKPHQGGPSGESQQNRWGAPTEVFDMQGFFFSFFAGTLYSSTVDT